MVLMQERPVSVVVAALTYRRPGDLRALIPLLIDQVGSVAQPTRVIIVDNDPQAGAREAVAAFAPLVEYHHAPKPGIAAARNVALDAADDADLLVFIDDDERPSERWLEYLLATWHASYPAAVVGPVVSEYEVQPDHWVVAGRFFERRRLRTGTETDLAATNNLLLDLAFVRRSGLRFDDRFGLTGGSDSLFTRQIHATGGRMVWCDEAVVTDVVPAVRVTRDWVLKRAYRSGNTSTLTSLAMARGGIPRFRAGLAAAARGVPRLIAGILGILLGAALARVDLRARGRRTAARGAGMLAGIAGIAYVEYRR